MGSCYCKVSVDRQMSRERVWEGGNHCPGSVFDCSSSTFCCALVLPWGGECESDGQRAEWASQGSEDGFIVSFDVSDSVTECLELLCNKLDKGSEETGCSLGLCESKKDGA